MPRDAINSVYVLYFARVEAISMPRDATNEKFVLCFTRRDGLRVQ